MMMMPPPEGNVFITDGNNYTAMGSLTISGVETAVGTDIDICWGGISKDLQCHDVNPLTQIDAIGLIAFRLSEAAVQAQLSSGVPVEMASTTGYLEHRTNKTSTCAKLYGFTFLGTAVDVKSRYTEPMSADESYMAIFTHGIERGVGARSMIFLRPRSTSTATTVEAPSGCGMLDFQANLMALQKLPVPAAGPWVIDWRGLTKDGQGNAVVFENIDGVMLGFYQNMTVADIQAKILDIEQIATSAWELKLRGGSRADLAAAKERTTGAAFSGFQSAATGTWLLALTCSKCQNPAPIVLTVLDPMAGAM
jgi:hypothetical protein